MSSYPEILFRGLDAKTKEDFKRYLHTSPLIEQVVKIVKAWKEENNTIPRDDYESPAWACKQADRNGSDRAYNQILKLLDHKEKNG